MIGGSRQERSKEQAAKALQFTFYQDYDGERKKAKMIERLETVILATREPARKDTLGIKF